MHRWNKDDSLPWVIPFQLLRHVTIASGGVLPKIHPELLSRKKNAKSFGHMSPPPSVEPVSPASPPPVKRLKVVPSSPAARKMPPKKAIALARGKPKAIAKVPPTKAAKVS